MVSANLTWECRKDQERRMYKTAHKAVCKIIHVCATLILPCENNKSECVCLNPKISEHCYTNLWICGSITVNLCFTNRKNWKHWAAFRWLHKCLCLVLVVWSKAACCSALLGQLHCSSWRKQGTSDFWRTDGLRGLLRRQWLRTGNSRWKDLNKGETILFMIMGAKQCQSCGKWIRVYLTPDLSIASKASSFGSFYVPNQTGALGSLSPGSSGICWIRWCLYVT